MVGLQIQAKGKKWAGIQTLAVLAVTSMAFGIWLGPFWVYVSSGLGLLVCVLAILLKVKTPAAYPGFTVYMSLFVLHGFFILGGWVLYSLFLQPLPKEALKMPKIAEPYSDPGYMFTLKGPTGWDYSMIQSSEGNGVRMTPLDQNQYMGASEIQVWVRELEEEPASPERFLELMAKTFTDSKRQNGNKKMFELKMEHIETLSGHKGVLSTLDIKRFWIPLQQVTLFGIKKGRYLCSVSSTSIRSHATLSRILCLGLFETIEPGAVSKPS